MKNPLTRVFSKYSSIQLSLPKGKVPKVLKSNFRTSKQSKTLDEREYKNNPILSTMGRQDINLIIDS